MPASAALRRLGAIVPLTAAALIGSALLLAPAATADGAPSTGALNAVAHTRSGGPAQPGGETLIEKRIHQAANVAIAHIGDWYHYGSAGPHEFDCSGLSMYSYDHSRLSLPRTAAGQYAAVHHIIKAHMVRGDLVFFHDSHGHVYHVGIFLYWNANGVAVIVHAPHTGERVHREPVWTSAWYAGTRRP